MRRTKIITIGCKINGRASHHLFAILALVGPLPVVLRQRMLDNVVLPQHCQPADLAVVLPNGERELGVMKDGAMESVVEGMGEAGVAASAIWKGEINFIAVPGTTRNSKSKAAGARDSKSSERSSSNNNYYKRSRSSNNRRSDTGVPHFSSLPSSWST